MKAHRRSGAPDSDCGPAAQDRRDAWGLWLNGIGSVLAVVAFAVGIYLLV